MMFSSLNKQRNVTKLIQFTDGCSQYKSKSPFLDINNGKLKHLLWILKDMSGIYRGKGPADVCSRVARSAISRALKAGNVMNTSQDVFTYLSNNIFLFVIPRTVTGLNLTVLEWWKSNEQKYLAVPASSVASVFGLCGQIEQKEMQT
jgi:hypothetical protein